MAGLINNNGCWNSSKKTGIASTRVIGASSSRFKLSKRRYKNAWKNTHFLDTVVFCILLFAAMFATAYSSSSSSSSLQQRKQDHHHHHRQELTLGKDTSLSMHHPSSSSLSSSSAPASSSLSDKLISQHLDERHRLPSIDEEDSIAFDSEIDVDDEEDAIGRTARDTKAVVGEAESVATTAMPQIHDDKEEPSSPSPPPPHSPRHQHHHHRQNRDKGVPEMEDEGISTTTTMTTTTTTTTTASDTLPTSVSAISTAITVTPAPSSFSSSVPPEASLSCSFGGKGYKIGDSFNPDLGEPFGVMFCIRCTCILVERRGKYFSRVKCKNYKNSCPIPNCPRPELGPRSCCKICPGQEDPATWTTASSSSSSSSSSSGTLSEEPQRSEGGLTKRDAQNIEKRFMALLTGNMVRPRRESSGVARGYFHLDDTNLHYSIHFRGMPRRVEAIVFLDTFGTALYFHQVKPLPGSEYFGFKICGVWKNLKPHQIEKLLEDRVRVTLTTSKYPSGEIGGLLRTHRVLDDESFSGVLAPPSGKDKKRDRHHHHHHHRHNHNNKQRIHDNDSSTKSHSQSFVGGAAVTFAVTKNLLNFVIFPDEDFIDLKSSSSSSSSYLEASKVIVRLESQRRGSASVEIGASVTSDWKWVEIADVFKLTETQLRDLASGSLKMVVISADGKKTLSGRIFPKQECGVIHALLAENVGAKKRVEAAAGSAVFKLYPDGNLAYKIRIDGVEEPVDSIALHAAVDDPFQRGSGGGESNHGSNKKSFYRRQHPRHPLAEFARNYNPATKLAVGKYEKVSAAVIQLLMTENLYLHVFTSRRSSSTAVLTGHLNHIQVGGNMKNQLEDPGVILHEEEEEQQRRMLTLGNGGKGEKNKNKNIVVVHNPASSSSSSSSSAKFYAGAAGVVWFEMDKDCHLHYKVLTSGLPLTGVSLSLRLNDHEARGGAGRNTFSSSSSPYRQRGRGGSGSGSNGGEVILKTFSGFESEGVYRESLPDQMYHALQSGSATVQLTSDSSSRITGRTFPVRNSCFARLPNPPLIKEEEESNRPNVIEQYCLDEDGEDRKPGSSWTPKRDRCETCTCSNHGQVQCQRAVCPRLVGCDGRQSTPPGACCPICANGDNDEEDNDDDVDDSVGLKRPTLNQTSLITSGVVANGETKKSCFFDGDKKWHPVGSTWHPYVPPFGYVKCAVCRCAASGDGVNCTRNPCPPLACPPQYATRRHPTDCCKTCDPNYSPKPKPTRPPQDDVPEGSCYFNKEYHLDGSRWHPRVIPIGVMRCITCQCHSGKSTCSRMQCPKLKCRRRIKRPNACCPVCAPSKSGNDATGSRYRYRQSLRMRARQRRQRRN